MPGVEDLAADEVREALRLLGADEATIAAGSRKALKEHLLGPGKVTDLLERAPDGAEELFRRLSVDGAASVEDLLHRGWAGIGQLPAPLDWLQRRGLVMVGREGLVHATQEARAGFASMTLDLVEPDPVEDAPFVVEAVRTVLIAPTEAALDVVTAIEGASLRTVAPTVAVSDRSPAAVQAALQSTGHEVTSTAQPAPSVDTPVLPGTEEDAVGPRAIRLLLHQALEEQRQVRLEYFASSRGGQATERVVDPWTFDDHLLRGYCHLRGDERAFALDRIGHARLLVTPLTHQPGEGT